MMATQATPSMHRTQRRSGAWTKRAIVAAVLVAVLVSVLGSTSVDDALARVSAIGVGIAIAAACCVVGYLMRLAALDGASRQFGHAWRQRTR
jgi:hypothetical protein